MICVLLCALPPLEKSRKGPWFFKSVLLLAPRHPSDQIQMAVQRPLETCHPINGLGLSRLYKTKAIRPNTESQRFRPHFTSLFCPTFRTFSGLTMTGCSMSVKRSAGLHACGSTAKSTSPKRNLSSQSKVEQEQNRLCNRALESLRDD